MVCIPPPAMMEFDPVLLHEWLRRSARRRPDKTALICGDVRRSYAELDASSDRLAASLCALGLRGQDRVVILMDSSVEAVIALYAVLKAGGVFVMLNGGVKAPKLDYVLRDAGAGILITHVSKAAVTTKAGADKRCRVVWAGPDAQMPGPSSKTCIGWGRAAEEADGAQPDVGTEESGATAPCVIETDLAALVYTSGSTGEPKGVMCTHHNMVSAARSIIQYVGNDERDVILNVLPLSFDYGLYQVLMAVMFGGTVVLEPSFAYLHRALERIGQERVTGFPVVPTIVAMLLAMQDPTKYDLSSLRYLTNTGAALPEEHIRRLRALLPGAAVFSMFGLTECKRVCYLPPGEIDRRPGSVGKPMPNTKARVVDEAGRETGTGETGELIVQGPHVTQGYWNDPDLTARTFRPGRYREETILHTGDWFRKDEEGFLYFVGRRDDLIKSRGERISAREVESAICGLAGVAECAVVGVPDEILGQAVQAFIVRGPQAGLTEKDVLRHCAENLEPFAVPKHVAFVLEIPRTAHGKVDREGLMNGSGPAA